LVLRSAFIEKRYKHIFMSIFPQTQVPGQGQGLIIFLADGARPAAQTKGDPEAAC
jgi:hypothetical protein